MSSLSAYLQQCAVAFNRRDSAAIVSLLRLDGAAMGSAAEKVAQTIRGDETIIGDVVAAAIGHTRGLTAPFDEVCLGHIACCVFLRQGDDDDAAFVQLDKGVLALLRLYEDDDTFWLLPLLKRSLASLRHVAVRAQRQLDQNKLTHTAGGKTLNRITDVVGQLRSAFTKSFNDRSSNETSKKWGAVAVANHLFHLFFRTNNLTLVTQLTRAIDGPSFLPLAQFPASEQVTYNYFTGRLALYDGNYSKAVQRLGAAFRRCHRTASHNKSTILLYLLAARLSLGSFPSTELLTRHGRAEFIPIVAAVRSGNLTQLNDALAAHQVTFVRSGIYLILEKLRIFAYRNLLKRVHTINGQLNAANSTKLALEQFAVALRIAGSDMAMDEIECVVATLIHQKLVRGYIHHAGPTLVLAKDRTFPKPSF